MMLNLASTMKSELATIKNKNEYSLAFIFFDGEEAFKQWGPRDSIYGARHLAKQWNSDTYITKDKSATTQIDRLVIINVK